MAGFIKASETTQSQLNAGSHGSLFRFWTSTFKILPSEKTCHCKCLFLAYESKDFTSKIHILSKVTESEAYFTEVFLLGRKSSLHLRGNGKWMVAFKRYLASCGRLETISAQAGLFWFMSRYRNLRGQKACGVHDLLPRSRQNLYVSKQACRSKFEILRFAAIIILGGEECLLWSLLTLRKQERVTASDIFIWKSSPMAS